MSDSSCVSGGDSDSNPTLTLASSIMSGPDEEEVVGFLFAPQCLLPGGLGLAFEFREHSLRWKRQVRWPSLTLWRRGLTFDRTLLVYRRVDADKHLQVPLIRMETQQHSTYPTSFQSKLPQHTQQTRLKQGQGIIDTAARWHPNRAAGPVADLVERGSI